MAEQDEAIKYLFGLESFPSLYEVTQASEAELEERVNNWQEQIFTLAGQLADMNQKFDALKAKNYELEQNNLMLQSRLKFSMNAKAGGASEDKTLTELKLKYDRLFEENQRMHRIYEESLSKDAESVKKEEVIQKVTTELNETHRQLAEANDKINDLFAELESQRKYYQDLLEKKSYLPMSYETLDTCVDDELTFVIDGSHKLIKTGSIQKLMDYLSDPSLSDIRFLQIFVFCFPMFMESKTFLKLLLARLNQLKDTNDVLKISRIINILKYWVENYFDDFEKEYSLIGKLSAQLEIYKNKEGSSLSGMSQMILKQINKNMTRTRRLSQTVKISAPSQKSDFLKRVVSLKKKKNNIILDSTPEEVAKQLTLLDFKRFSAINIREFLNLNWMKPDKKFLSPGLTAYIQWSNHVSFWVSTEILTRKTVKERATVMEFMISLAQSLEKLNNFHSLANVLSGLNISPVFRLKKTKENLSDRSIKLQASLEEITSSELNYKKFRQKISMSQPPLIPFLGIYQGDLVFLDSTGSTLLDNGIINFQKVYRMASHVIDLKSYQDTPYFFSLNTEIQDYIANFCPLSEDDAYAVSLAYEPRS